MKEVEIKAHATEDLRSTIESITGMEGRTVDKWDQYFHLPGCITQKIRLRKNNGVLEMTTKEQKFTGETEDNAEYEIKFSMDQYDNAHDLINSLGYVDYFVKIKKGWDWTWEGVHIELLKVNDIGWFLEMEALIPLDSSREDVEKAQDTLFRLLHEFGLSDDAVEKTSYRTMIIGV